MPEPSPAPATPPAAASPAIRPWRRHLLRQVAVLLLVAALIAIGYVGNRALRHMGPPERCWEYQERDGKLYKINPCTGQFQLIGDVVTPAPDK